MSLYTAGEIVVWLVLAAALGAVLGWLVGSARGTDTRRPARPAARTRSSAVAAFTAPDGGAPLPGRTPDGSTPEDPAPEPAPAPRRDASARHGKGAQVTPGAFRGSALPGHGGDAPAPEYVVKANVDAMTYHLPDTPTHARVHADVWFKDADAARAAGFRPPPSQV